MDARRRVVSGVEMSLPQLMLARTAHAMESDDAAKGRVRGRGRNGRDSSRLCDFNGMACSAIRKSGWLRTGELVSTDSEDSHRGWRRGSGETN
jgi:hypothetical protein